MAAGARAAALKATCASKGGPAHCVRAHAVRPTTHPTTDGSGGKRTCRAPIGGRQLEELRPCALLRGCAVLAATICVGRLPMNGRAAHLREG